MKKIKVSLVLSAFLILILVCGGLYSLAYLNQTTNSVTNQFLDSTFDLTVKEDFETDDEVKKNVYIQNTGEVPMYVRVKFLVQAQDEDGTIIANPIVVDDLNSRGMDIEDFEISKIDGWTEIDGYYYYPELINPNEEVLFFERARLREEVVFTGTYTPVLTISAQGVQANAIELDNIWNRIKIDEYKKLIPSGEE